MFTLQQLTDLAASFPHLPRLTSLTVTLCEPGLGDGMVPPFLTSLSHLHSLSSLTLSNIPLSTNSCISLASSLQNLSSLHSLNLSFNRISDNGCSAICDALVWIASSLKVLNLSVNNIHDSGGHALCSLLPHLVALTSLDLRNNEFSDESRAVLIEAVSSLSFLKQFELERFFPALSALILFS